MKNMFNKRKFCSLIMPVVTSIFLGWFVFQLSVVAQAEEVPIQQDINYKDALLEKIPADNTFIFRYTSETKVDYLSGYHNKGRLMVGNGYAESQALVRNVGKYKGQNVNIKITLTRDKGGVDLHLTQSEFLNMSVWAPDAYGEISFEFQDDAGNPLPLKTTLNFAGLTKMKDIYICNAHSAVNGLYATYTAPIFADYDPTQDFLKLRSEETDKQSNDSRLATTNNEITQLKFQIKNNRKDDSGEWFYYSSKFFPAVEFSKPQIQSTAYDNFIEKPQLAIYQEIPLVQKDYYLSSLGYQIKLAEKQYELTDFDVKDELGKSYKNSFTLVNEGNQGYRLEASSTLLADPAFYDHLYRVELKHQFVGIKNHQSVSQNAINANNEFVQELEIKLITNQKKYEPQIGTVTIPYGSKVSVDFLSKEADILKGRKELNGIISQPFDVSKEYPKIPGYLAQRNSLDEDQGVFQPAAQLIKHYYIKLKPLLFNLEDREDPLHFSRLDHRRNLAVSLSCDPLDHVRLKARYQQQEVLIKDYPVGTNTQTEKVPFVLPKAWDGKEIAFYLESETGAKSAEVVRKVMIEKGPELFLPAAITFGQHEIPAHNCQVVAQNTDQVKVQANSEFSQQNWRLSVEIDQPLMDQEGKKLNTSIQFVGTGGASPIDLAQTSADIQGQGDQSLAQSGQLVLQLSPELMTGSYQGSLLWTLSDAPS